MRFKDYLIESIEGSKLPNITLLAKLFPENANAKRAGRTGTVSHVRISLRDEPDILKWLHDLDLDISFEDEPSTIASGMFKTWKGTVKKDLTVDGKIIAEKGNIFYVVNTIKENTKVKRKEFEPAKFNLNNENSLSESEIIKKVEKELDGSKFNHYSDDERDYFKKLLQKSKSAKASHPIKAPESMSSEDLKILGINFGEILSALWCLNKIKGDAIIFPKNDLPLIDFSITTGHEVRDFSAKSAGDGGPPSMDVIAKFIEDFSDEFSEFNSNKLDIIKILHKESILTGILKSSKLLKTSGYSVLEKIAPVNCQHVKELEHWLRSISSVEELKSTLEPLYKATKSRPMQNARTDSIQELFDAKKAPMIGLVISPLAYHLVEDVLNKDEEFSEILNKAAQLMTVSQVYTNISKTEITFELKEFKQNKFKWKNNATSKNPSNKKISFVMSH